MRVSRIGFVLACVVVGAAGSVLAESQATPWGELKTPAPGAPLAIGDYSAGCIQGAHALPLSGKGYEVMHPSRRRYFGHPSLVDFIETLGRGVAASDLSSLLVGDLSQPRGGRASGGHASHQTGLDVDLWYIHPASLPKKLRKSDRESAAAQSVLAEGAIQKAESERVQKLLQLTAADARVERIFVHPLIKRALCASAGSEPSERAWLAKLRPWYGHDDHFHVRLACPKDSPDCSPQEPAPPGDGCDQLDYWLSDAKRAERERGQQEYQHKVVSPRVAPAQCEAVRTAK